MKTNIKQGDRVIVSPLGKKSFVGIVLDLDSRFIHVKSLLNGMVWSCPLMSVSLEEIKPSYIKE